MSVHGGQLQAAPPTSLIPKSVTMYEDLFLRGQLRTCDDQTLKELFLLKPRRGDLFRITKQLSGNDWLHLQQGTRSLFRIGVEIWRENIEKNAIKASGPAEVRC